MKNKLKCYMFFMKEDEYVKLKSYNINNKSMSYDLNDDSLCLYAYTFNKADAQEFKDMRNMKLFDFKVKKATNEDIEEMSRNFGLCKLIILSDAEPTCPVGLLVTKEEYLTMQTCCNRKISVLNWELSDYPSIFNKGYLKALEVLKYRELTCDGDKFDLVTDGKIKIDYLSIFVSMFGKLLRLVV